MKLSEKPTQKKKQEHKKYLVRKDENCQKNGGKRQKKNSKFAGKKPYGIKRKILKLAYLKREKKPNTPVKTNSRPWKFPVFCPWKVKSHPGKNVKKCTWKPKSVREKVCVKQKTRAWKKLKNSDFWLSRALLIFTGKKITLKVITQQKYKVFLTITKSLVLVTNNCCRRKTLDKWQLAITVDY